MAGAIQDMLGGAGGKQQKLVQSVVGMLASNSKFGGLSGLLERFQSKGMGAQASSWVSRGENQAVSGQQIRDALGDDEVQRVAADAGMSKQETADGLAKVLPQAVDQATPEGKVPQGNALEGALGSLKSRFGL